MWSHLDQHTKIETIFEPFLNKANEYNCPWSIAELRLKKNDIEWLQTWLNNLGPKDIENWIKTIIFCKGEKESLLTYRQMFGALIICAAAEICREESREDSVWPTIRKLLSGSAELHNELFLSNGQPSLLTKNVISEAVRTLNLRHALDIEGTQQWFTTIKLQFGFTFSGAKNRLAEWLVNLGTPHTVQYLKNESEFPDLTSKSFQDLWQFLKQYRQGLIKESELRKSLQDNPWIKSHWLDDLVMEAKARIATLGRGEGDFQNFDVDNEDTNIEDFCPIQDVALDWPQGKQPRIKLNLDRQAIEEEISGTTLSELDFYVDGRKIKSWYRQRDGSWDGQDYIFAEPESLKLKPNLKPMTFSIHSRSGEQIVEWDLNDSGLLNDVILFDLNNNLLSKSEIRQLDQNRNYAIICDSNCELKGCDDIETFSFKENQKKVLRLPVPLPETVSIEYENFVLWQMEIKEAVKTPLSISLSNVTSKWVSLNDRTQFVLNGLPEESQNVQLLIHKKIYDFDKQGDAWVSLKDITITPKLAARQRRVRVRFILGDKKFTREPRLEFLLLGAAMFRQSGDKNSELSFDLLKKGDVVNRQESTSLRIWIPNPDKSTAVYEENHRVARLRHHKIKLNELPGHGGRLYVSSQGENYDLELTSCDKGCVQRYVPPLLGSEEARLFLSREIDPNEAGDNRYGIYMWNGRETNNARVQRIPNECILPGSNKRLWKIKNKDNPLAVALTWKGYWLGAWWDIERIADYVSKKNDITETEFAILKWLRVPVLNPKLAPAIRKVALKYPSRFLKAWIYNSGLGPGIKQHENIAGVDSVVRYFLWTDFPIIQVDNIIGLITNNRNNWSSSAQCNSYLDKFGEISPFLLWEGFVCCLNISQGGQIKNILDEFLHFKMDLMMNAPNKYIEYRIDKVKNHLDATGFKLEDVDFLIENFIESLKKRQNDVNEPDRTLFLQLSRSKLGRKYLSYKLAKYWFDIVNS